MKKVFEVITQATNSENSEIVETKKYVTSDLNSFLSVTKYYTKQCEEYFLDLISIKEVLCISNNIGEECNNQYDDVVRRLGIMTDTAENNLSSAEDYKAKYELGMSEYKYISELMNTHLKKVYKLEDMLKDNDGCYISREGDKYKLWKGADDIKLADTFFGLIGGED